MHQKRSRTGRSRVSRSCWGKIPPSPRRRTSIRTEVLRRGGGREKKTPSGYKTVVLYHSGVACPARAVARATPRKKPKPPRETKRRFVSFRWKFCPSRSVPAATFPASGRPRGDTHPAPHCASGLRPCARCAGWPLLVSRWPGLPGRLPRLPGRIGHPLAPAGSRCSRPTALQVCALARGAQAASRFRLPSLSPIRARRSPLLAWSVLPRGEP